MKKTIFVIHGPNLNMLGIREPDKYGNETYDMLISKITDYCHANFEDLECEFYQSNHEGALVDRIQQAYFEKADGIVINPGAYTHTSIAIPDALRCLSVPVAEVHLSDINNREEYRKHSYISETASFFVCGKGFEGYREAILFFVHNGEKL